MTNTALTTALETHRVISSYDLAYQYSVEHNDLDNMAMVLRAHGKDYSREAAALQLQVANNNNNTGAAAMHKETLIAILEEVSKKRTAYQREDLAEQTDYTMGKLIAADQMVELLQDTLEAL